MTGNFLILNERAESYDGKRGKVTMRILALLDQDNECGMLNTVDYVVPADETERFNGELAAGQKIKLGINSLRAAFGNRFRLEGKILTEPRHKPEVKTPEVKNPVKA
jgi:hypothetical protein